MRAVPDLVLGNQARRDSRVRKGQRFEGLDQNGSPEMEDPRPKSMATAVYVLLRSVGKT